MMKTGMYGTGVNIIAQCQLLYPAQALKIGVLYNIKNQFVWYGNKTVYRVVKYFALVHTLGAKKQVITLLAKYTTNKPVGV